MKPKKLIEYLNNQGLRGDKLAEILGISRVTVSNMKNGETEKLNYIYIERAAEELGISTAELVAKLEKVS